MQALDPSGRVRARNFKYQGERFIVRLEDEFFDELNIWARSENFSVSQLVWKLFGAAPAGANRSAFLRTEIIRHLAAERNRAKVARAEMVRDVNELIDHLPLPVFSTEGILIESFNEAFQQYVQRKLRFPPGLTMKFIVKVQPKSGPFRASIVLPGFVLPVLCERIPIRWSEHSYFAINV